MVAFGWFCRVLGIIGVGFGIATVALQSRRAMDNKTFKGELAKLFVAFWCIFAGSALFVIAETLQCIKPQWLAITIAAIECLLWLAVLVEFGFRRHD